jgi:hypothetical protein
MAIGVATPKVPVSNDIILGEFKVYANYGTPSELLLGATREGCKLSIDRSVKELAFDGSYGYTLDSNGVPLVRHEKIDAMLTLNSLYLKYFNKKNISDCEPNGTWESQDWALTGGTYAAETAIVNSGLQSAKCTASTTGHGSHEVFATTKNLNLFDNAEVSGTSDYITFSIYITAQNKTDLGTADIRFSIHKDAEDTETNFYYYDIANSALTADRWNNFKILKSAFTETGTASWTDVTGISFKLDGVPSAEVEFYVDSIDLLQNQSNSSIVPINGHGFDMTNQTTYREMTPNLEILDADYYENITLVGQRHDGKKVKIVMKNCLNDGKIELALEEKDEVVNETQFTAHYDASSPLVVPIALYEYV